MSTLRLLIALIICSIVAGPVSALSAEEDPVLGSDGTIYRLLQGQYADLFPLGSMTAADAPVLALDVTGANGEVQRLLVPGTETRDREASPVLLLEESTQRIYLLWEELFNGIHPLLQLTSFDGEIWTPVVEIASGPFSRKGSPRLEVTRDAGGLNSGADGITDRSVAHLTWWQGGASGASKKFYAPMALAGGAEQGTTPVFDLAAFFASGEDAQGDLQPAFSDLLVIEPGGESSSAVMAFLDSRTHNVRSLRSEMIPGVLSSFADKARLEIVIIGQRFHGKRAIAERMRSKLMELGGDFHPASLAYIVDSLAEFIEGWQGDLSREGQLEFMAGKARLEIVIIGSTIDANGLPADADAYLLEVGAVAEGQERPGLLKLSRGGEWALPPIDDRVTTARLFVSKSGRQVLLAWEGERFEDRVTYRISNEEGWSDASYLSIRADLDRDTVYRLLAEQVRNH